MARATRGKNAQFTYDFGISISQATLNKLTRLTGVTLSLASAYYSLKSSAEEYIGTLRETSFKFGGTLSALKAMEEAQARLVKGQSKFSVADQLQGMQALNEAGIKNEKQLKWIDKAAHAVGQSYSDFSSAITNAISGNTSQLVEMGIISEKESQKFEVYAANSIARQEAIMKYLQNHKGLMEAIRNDYDTIQDQMNRIRESWNAFIQSLLGKPNDPNSFYGQIVNSMRLVADALGRNLEQIKRVGYVIGSVLGWIIKQIGYFVVWLGRGLKSVVKSLVGTTDNYVEFTRSLLVWLEFWKVRIVQFFKEYKDVILGVIKAILLFKTLKFAFVIGKAAIASVYAYAAAIKSTILLQKRFIAFYGAGGPLSKLALWMASFAAWLPQPFRAAWVAIWGSFYQMAVAIEAYWVSHMVPFFVGVKTFLIGIFSNTWGIIKAGFMLLFDAIMVFATGTLSLFTGFSKTWVTLFKRSCGIMMLDMKLLGLHFKGLLVTLWSGLTSVIKGLYSLLTTFGSALLALNPIAWIAAAIAVVAVLYAKCEGFRKFVNEFLKQVWELLKLIWNLLYNAILYVIKGLKWVWNAFKEYVWTPIANFFKNAYEWIAGLWDRFKDSSVGKWLNKWIIQPLKTLFDAIAWVWNKIVDGAKWLWNKIKGIWEWFKGGGLSRANDALAENANREAANLGLPQWGASGSKPTGSGSSSTQLTAHRNNYGFTGEIIDLRQQRKGRHGFTGKVIDLRPDSGEGRVPSMSTALSAVSTGTSSYEAPKAPRTKANFATMPEASGVGTFNMSKVPTSGEPDFSYTPSSSINSSAIGNGSRSNGAGSTTINISNGAIQINIPQGAHIDERKLATMIREEIRNYDRNNNMRGGSI